MTFFRPPFLRLKSQLGRLGINARSSICHLKNSYASFKSQIRAHFSQKAYLLYSLLSSLSKSLLGLSLWHSPTPRPCISPSGQSPHPRGLCWLTYLCVPITQHSVWQGMNANTFQKMNKWVNKWKNEWVISQRGGKIEQKKRWSSNVRVYLKLWHGKKPRASIQTERNHI